MVASTPRPAPQAECIICGASHPDLAIEERVQLARLREGAASDSEGCGRTMVWTVAYRCVDCGRWFHRECIRRHFASSGCHEQTPLSMLVDIGTAVTEGVVRPVRALTYPVDIGAQLLVGTFLFAWRFGRTLIGSS